MLAPKPVVSQLRPELIELYARAMTRLPPDDWRGMTARVQAARELAEAAFQRQDRGAWEIVQVMEWHLQKSTDLRPTDPGDVQILDLLYRAEESVTPVLEVPPNLAPLEFAQKLSDDCYALNALETPVFKLLDDASVDRDLLKYIFYQAVPPSLDFTKMLAVASVRFPFELALSIFENLYDEAGAGNRDRAHFRLLSGDAAEFGVKMDPSLESLEWILPEIIANTNCTLRMLWHEDWVWGLGAMFVMERLLPPEMMVVRKALLQVKTPRMEFFDAHITGDEKHAAEWLELVAQYLVTQEQRTTAYNAAIRRGEWNRLGWITIHQGYQRWKTEGVRPHLPFRELQDATGLVFQARPAL